MTDLSNWFIQLEETWRNTITSIIAYLPNLIGVLLLLLLGWLLAKLARLGVKKLGGVVNRVLLNLLEGTSATRFKLTTRSMQIAGNAAFWLVILFFLTAAAETAKLEAFSIWLDRILAFFPVLLAGGLIIFAGYIASQFVRDVLAAALASSGIKQSALLARLAQVGIFLTAVIIGVDQVGLDISFLITVIAISMASIFGGVALAFGFGSRDFVANVIAAHNLQQQYKPGQMVKLGKTGGEILELTSTAVILATDEGRTVIPANLFHQNISILLTQEDSVD